MPAAKKSVASRIVSWGATRLYNPELRFFEHRLPRRVFGWLIAALYAFAGVMPIAHAFGLEVAGGTIFVWCLLITLGLAVCFYNKLTALAAIVAGAAYLYLKVNWLAVLEWATGELPGAIMPLLSGEGEAVISPEMQSSICLALASVLSFLSYMSAGRLAGGGTMCVMSLAIYLGLWYFGARDFFGYMAIAAAAIATVCAASYGRKRSYDEEYDIEYDVDERDAGGTEADLEPRIISGGGASAIAFGASVYAALAALLTWCVIH